MSLRTALSTRPELVMTEAAPPIGPDGAPTVRDLAETLRSLGIESVRFALVELASGHSEAIWTIDERGAVAKQRAPDRLDTFFPLANAMVSELERMEAWGTAIHRRSPHRRVYAWRVDETGGILAQIHSAAGRSAAAEMDSAIVQLICEIALRAGHAARIADAPEASGPVWPQVDRRAPARLPATVLAALLLVGVATLFSAWTAFAPALKAREDSARARQEVARLQAMAERTMVRDLSNLLAGGDYGEVQEALSSYAELGYFDGAVIINARRQVVSSAGNVADLPIGGPVPDSFARSARVSELKVGAQRYGELHALRRAASAEPAPDPASAGALVFARIVMFAALITAAVLLAMTLWRRAPRRRE
jgi:hypothetical protein